MPRAPAAQSESGEDKKLVLRIGDTNDIDGFNPFKLVEVPSFEIMDLTYDLLVDFSPKDSSPVPGLADSWEHSKDGLTWTFHLNKDAKWQDGKPVTSEDVAYTFNRILDEKQGLFIDYVKQIDKIETPDKHTVVFTTKKPSVQMLSMYVYILPKHIWEKVPPDETKTFVNQPAIGSGPFQAVEWKKGQYARLKANPDYFRGAPKFDEIIFQFYDNDDTMVQALKNGDVDYISGHAHQPVQIPREPGRHRDQLGPRPRVHRARLQPLRALTRGDKGVRRPEDHHREPGIARPAGAGGYQLGHRRRCSDREGPAGRRRPRLHAGPAGAGQVPSRPRRIRASGVRHRSAPRSC